MSEACFLRCHPADLEVAWKDHQPTNHLSFSVWLCGGNAIVGVRLTLAVKHEVGLSSSPMSVTETDACEA